MVKKAFTLIELIFTIVVLSIAFLAIPQLFTMTSLNIEQAIKDEATFQGIRSLYSVITYVWDEKSIDDNGSYRILDTQGDIELNRTVKPYRRGHYALYKSVIDGGSAYRYLGRRFYDNPTYASAALGSDAGDSSPDDIDDFNNQTETITSLIQDLNVKIKVFYVSDSTNYDNHNVFFNIPVSSLGRTTNIKMIEVNVTTTDNKEVLVYRSLVCNLGSAKIKTRTFQ